MISPKVLCIISVVLSSCSVLAFSRASPKPLPFPQFLPYSCHISCDNAFAAWVNCGANSSDSAKKCTCTPGSTYLENIEECLKCGDSIWPYYGNRLEESLLLCATPTDPNIIRSAGLSDASSIPFRLISKTSEFLTISEFTSAGFKPYNGLLSLATTKLPNDVLFPRAELSTKSFSWTVLSVETPSAAFLSTMPFTSDLASSVTQVNPLTTFPSDMTFSDFSDNDMDLFLDCSGYTEDPSDESSAVSTYQPSHSSDIVTSKAELTNFASSTDIPFNYSTNNSPTLEPAFSTSNSPFSDSITSFNPPSRTIIFTESSASPVPSSLSLVLSNSLNISSPSSTTRIPSADNNTTTLSSHNSGSFVTSEKTSTSLLTDSFMETHTSAHKSKSYFTLNASRSDRPATSLPVSFLSEPSNTSGYPADITGSISDDSQIFTRTITYCSICSDTVITHSPTPHFTTYIIAENDGSHKVVTETYCPRLETSAPDVSVKSLISSTGFSTIAVTKPINSKVFESYISSFPEKETKDDNTINLKTSEIISLITDTSIEAIASSTGITSLSMKTSHGSVSRATDESAFAPTMTQTNTKGDSKDASSETSKFQDIGIAETGTITKGIEITPLPFHATNLDTATKVVTVISSSSLPRMETIVQVDGAGSKVFLGGSYLVGFAGLIGFHLVI